MYQLFLKLDFSKFSSLEIYIKHTILFKKKKINFKVH